MESIIFLKEKLNDIFKLHSYLEIQYEYRSYIKTHIIEVKPVHCFESDKKYIDQQIKLEESFEEMFPSEEILFITDNELIQIENPLLKLGVSEIVVSDNYPIETEYFNFDETIDFELNYTSFTTSLIQIEEYVVNHNNEIICDIDLLTKIKNLKFPNKLSNILKKRKKDSEIKSESFFLLIL